MSAAAVGAAAAVGSLGYAISQSGGGAPAAPDYAAANTAGVVADASTLPYRKAIDALAKLGGKAMLKNPQTGQMEEVDFTGLGEADTGGANAAKMAAKVLEIQQKYGPDFIRQAKEQLALADPEGVAAREALYQQIMEAMGRVPEQPIADSLEAQILKELQAGASVDGDVAREIEQALTAEQTARGGGYGKADEYQRAMGMGRAAEQRRLERQMKAGAFLTSGHSRTDRDFRQRQQDLANLAAFLTGQTPTAQFQQLSGAQQGAAPFVPGSPGPSLNPNAGAQGAGFAQQSYQTQMANQPADAYLAGLGLGGQALGAVATAGGPMGFGWWGKKPGG